MKKNKFYAIFFVFIFSFSLARAVSIEGRQNTFVFTEIGVIGNGKTVINMQFIDSELIYIVEISDYLTVYDISDIDNIIQMDTVLLYQPYDLEIDKDRNIVYVTDTGGVNIFDCSNPADLQELSTYKNYSSSSFIQLRNELLYVGAEDYGLQVVNVTDPGNPFLIGNWSDPVGEVGQVYLKDNYAFVETYTPNIAAPPTYLDLKILNITNPKNITYVSTVNLGSTYHGGDPSAHFEDLVYVIDQTIGLKILNFTNPYDVFVEASYDDENCLYADLGLLDNDQVFLADYNLGLKVIDCFNLEDLYIRGTYQSSFNLIRVSIIASKIYLGTISGGVRILQLGYETLDVGFIPISIINGFVLAPLAYHFITKRKKR